ncbi:mechanosensitive ion channel [Desulfurivibrio dismutans]|uniref:mechanosensitive ion channel n=1 Tax=Desulfurivibrio dismutans TaxID=1398908 RepID=UPI0023DA70E4|nr:mechanosensitive ion channel [Desulfurivibrio alkaliphilus]MDF1614071.1 mechanosensitive ion channel [Desulfurivibrio alkaliphilus]
MSTIGEYLPSLLAALVVLVLGWLLIEVICRSVGKLLGLIKLDQRLQGEKAEPAVKMEGILVQILRYVLLISLFLLVLDILGVTDALAPVRDMFTAFLSAIPNILAAILIGVLGYILAQIASSMVTLLFKGVDRFNTQLGLAEGFSLSRLLGQLVFIIIFVPLLIVAFDALRLEAISVPATAMLEALMRAIPNILGAALILVVAFFIGRFVVGIIGDLLKNLGADELPAKLGIDQAFSEEFTFSKLVAYVAFIFIMLGAAISAVEMLELQRVSDLLAQLTQFAFQIALGVVVLAVGSFLATIAYRALLSAGTNEFLAMLARVAIIGLVVAMGLRQMGIADDIVRLAFGLTIGSVAVAFALAFGLGGREAAGKQLEIWFKKLNKEEQSGD